MSMNFASFINFKMPTFAGILTFMNRVKRHFWCSAQERSLIRFHFFKIYEDYIFHAQVSLLLCMNKFYNISAGSET